MINKNIILLLQIILILWDLGALTREKHHYIAGFLLNNQVELIISIVQGEKGIARDISKG